MQPRRMLVTDRAEPAPRQAHVWLILRVRQNQTMNPSMTRNIVECCVTARVDWQGKRILENFSLKDYGNWEAAEAAAKEWINSMLSKRSGFIADTSLVFWAVLTAAVLAALGYLRDARYLLSMAIPFGLFAYLSGTFLRRIWPRVIRKAPPLGYKTRYFSDPVIIMKLLAAMGWLIVFALELLKK